MIDRNTIHNLSSLARIKMTKDEEDALARDIHRILDFVGEIQKADVGGTSGNADMSVLRNVMREDGIGHNRGEHAGLLLDEAPDTLRGYIKVKKIL